MFAILCKGWEPGVLLRTSFYKSLEEATERATATACEAVEEIGVGVVWQPLREVEAA